MTDPDLVAKKLAFIETCVRELQTLARPDRLENHLGDLLEFVAAVRGRL